MDRQEDGIRESAGVAVMWDGGQEGEGEIEGSLLKKNDIRVGMGKEMNETRRAGGARLGKVVEYRSSAPEIRTE